MTQKEKREQKPEISFNASLINSFVSMTQKEKREQKLVVNCGQNYGVLASQ